MKQIKHIFVLLTIATCSLLAQSVQIDNFQTIPDQTLLERVMIEVQKTDHDPEQLLALMVMLLRHGVENNQPALYAQAVFKMFSNIVKGMPYINAYTLADSLPQIAEYIPHYIAQSNAEIVRNTTSLVGGNLYDHFKSTVNTMLYCKFSSEYAAFKESPEEFLQNISEEIALVNQYTIHLDKLRNTMVRFLELTLSKVIWSPENQVHTWVSVKEISQGLTVLFERGVLEDINDLDDLFWSLIHRYSYFLDVVGSLMHSHLYDEISKDIAAHSLLLLTLPEQDSFVLDKSSVLSRTIERLQEKIRLRATDSTYRL